MPGSQRIVEMSSRTPFFMDGHAVSPRDVARTAAAAHSAFAGPDNAVRGFTSIRGLEKWAAASPLLSPELKRGLKSVESRRDSILKNPAPVMNALRDLQTRLEDTDPPTARLNRHLTSEGTRELLRALCPKVSCVKFFKDAGYRKQFNELPGYLHWSNPWVGKNNNDKLSSIKLFGVVGLICYEDKNFGGRRHYFTSIGEFKNPDFSKSPAAWFNNMMSSYLFYL